VRVCVCVCACVRVRVCVGVGSWECEVGTAKWGVWKVLGSAWECFDLVW